MKETDLVQTALENLEKTTQIKGRWKQFNKKELDGKIELKAIDETVAFNVEVKTEIREYQLEKLLEQAEAHRPFMVIAQRIFPKIKEALRKHHIPYLEMNGNIWVHQDRFIIWIEHNKPIQAVEEKVNRAFTKTGLKVVFQFLSDEQWINYPYREIALKTAVGLGNINYVMNGLQENGFLVRQNQKEFRLIKKKRTTTSSPGKNFI